MVKDIGRGPALTCRSSSSVLFLALRVSRRFSPLPPPPLVNSTLIVLPSRAEWCNVKACCRLFDEGNSRNAQPFDLETGMFGRLALGLGVSRRTEGGSGHEAK